MENVFTIGSYRERIIMRLYMTKDEIRISYRDAMHKPEQIIILSQLNCCSQYDIQEVLGINKEIKDHASIGVRDYEMMRRREKCMKYYKLNYCDADIARRAHVSRYFVANWRIDNFLPPNIKLIHKKVLV